MRFRPRLDYSVHTGIDYCFRNYCYLPCDIEHEGGNTHDFVIVHNYPALIGTWISILTFTFYSALMDSSRKQATIGKSLLKIKAVGLDHQRIPFWRSFIKYIVMWTLPVYFLRTYWIGLIVIMAVPILFATRKQAIYDMIAGTLVVDRDALNKANCCILDENESVLPLHVE